MNEYVIQLRDERGVVVDQRSITGDFMTIKPKKIFTTEFQTEKKNYAVQIYAVGFWDNRSMPLWGREE